MHARRQEICTLGNKEERDLIHAETYKKPLLTLVVNIPSTGQKRDREGIYMR
jgi:hypothetical protein